MGHKAGFVQLPISDCSQRFLEGLKEHVVEISNYFFPPIDNSKLLKIASALPETQGLVTLSKWGFWYLL